jgi:hypothetical protein
MKEVGPPGGEILTCYTQTRWSTSPRQKHLLTTKYFRYFYGIVC